MDNQRTRAARRLFDRRPKNPAIARQVQADDEDAEDYEEELMDRAEQFHEECGDR